MSSEAKVEYLGDDVYIRDERNQTGFIVVYTREFPTNSIYFEPAVWSALKLYIARLSHEQ